MATYEEKRKEFSRTRCWYVELDLGFCGNVFGTAPCVATGTKCYNTYPTCKDRVNFTPTTRTYRFCSDVSTLPFGDGERPYIEGVSQLPTEIKNALTVKGRVKVNFVDEPDTDVGIDPYVSERTSTPGTFFKKLYARNLNFKGKAIRVYEGFLGIAQSEFQQRFEGTVEDFQFTGNGRVVIEGVDLIRDLKKVKIPPKYEINIAGDVTTASSAITFTGEDVLKLGSAATGTTVYLRMGDEVLSYVSSAFGAGNIISPISRAFKNTSAEEHSEGDKVSIVPHYVGNPFDVMKDLLTNPCTIITNPGAAISTAKVNGTAFDYWRDWYSTNSTAEVVVEGFLDEDMPVEGAYFDLVNLMNARSWVGEDLKVTVARQLPNNPGRTYPKLTDNANIILNSDGINTNDDSRFTRSFLLWDIKLTGDTDKAADFLRRNVHIDVEAESTNFYGEEIEDNRPTRFLRTGNQGATVVTKFAFNNIQRRLAIHKNAQPLLDVELEYKDSDIKTGSHVRVGTDALISVTGDDISSATFQVLKRDIQGDKVRLKLEKVRDEKVGYFQDTTAGVGSSGFLTASEAQGESGFFAAENSASSTAAVMSNSKPAYTFF